MNSGDSSSPFSYSFQPSKDTQVTIKPWSPPAPTLPGGHPIPGTESDIVRVPIQVIVCLCACFIMGGLLCGRAQPFCRAKLSKSILAFFYKHKMYSFSIIKQWLLY